MTNKLKHIMMSLLASFIFIFTNKVSAHCDTMEGPVVKASIKALETGNLNYVLIWVRIEDEEEIKALFDKVNKVRTLSTEAKELADMYFFETVIRVHRTGEGEPYTGIKPIGYHPSEGIEEADVAIEKNSLSEILANIPNAKHKEVKDLFNDLQSKTNYDVNNLAAGRKYVAAYVHFIHYVEGLFSGEENSVHEHHH